MVLRVRRSAARPLLVGLYGGFGVGNVGNDATICAVVEHLRRSRPTTELRLLTYADDAALVARRFGVATISLRRPRPVRPAGRVARLVGRPWRLVRLLAHAWASVRGVDVVVVTGGGVFEAEGTAGIGGWIGMVGLLSLALASSVGRHHHLAFVGVGGTYAPRRLERVLVAASTRRAEHRSFRDEESRTALLRMGGAAPGDLVGADLVFAREPVAGPERVDGGRPRVGIGVMGFPWLDLDSPGAIAADAYVDALVSTIASLVSGGDDVLIFGGDTADDPVVEVTSARARARLDDDGRSHVLVSEARSLEDQLSELATTDVVVSSRFHNVVATFLAERPVVAVADRAKVRRLMASAGLQDYVVEAATLTAAELLHVIEQARQEESPNRAAVARAREGQRVLARQELDALDRLIDGWGQGAAGRSDGAATVAPVTTESFPRMP